MYSVDRRPISVGIKGMLDNSFTNVAKTQLLAKIAMIDGAPSSPQEISAFTIIDMFNSAETAFLKGIYKKITTQLQSVDAVELVSMLNDISTSEKVELLRGCCYIALCDGALTPKKELTITQIGTQLGFADDDIQLAIKSVG